MKGKEREREKCVGGSVMAVCRNQWRERENKLLFYFVLFLPSFFLFALFNFIASLHFVGAENLFNFFIRFSIFNYILISDNIEGI